MTEEQNKLLNEIFDDYEVFLSKHDPIFLNNTSFFISLYNKLPDNEKIETQKYSNISGTNIILVLKEFYKFYYPENLDKLNKIFNDGTINVFYRNEDVCEQDNIIYDKDYLIFRQNRINNHKNLNIPLSGKTTDIACFAHEIRHYFNDPEIEQRNCFNDLMTESLSIFEELLISKFLNDKYDNDELISFEREMINNYYLNSKYYIIFICKCLYIKTSVGTINSENYEYLFEDDSEDFIKNCLVFLKEHKDFRNIDTHKKNWYLFGIMLAGYIYEQYSEGNIELKDYKKLNEDIKNNISEESLKNINLDITDENFVDIINENFKNFIKRYSSTNNNNKVL